VVQKSLQGHKWDNKKNKRQDEDGQRLKWGKEGEQRGGEKEVKMRRARGGEEVKAGKGSYKEVKHVRGGKKESELGGAKEVRRDSGAREGKEGQEERRLKRGKVGWGRAGFKGQRGLKGGKMGTGKQV